MILDGENLSQGHLQQLALCPRGLVLPAVAWRQPADSVLIQAANLLVRARGTRLRDQMFGPWTYTTGVT
jgi:hypothetical protein